MKTLPGQAVSRPFTRNTRLTYRAGVTSLLVLFSAVAFTAEEDDAFTAGLTAIRERVAAAKLRLGDKAGVPEVPDQYQSIPRNGRWLTAAEVAPTLARFERELARHRWWRIGLDPTNLDHALREPAAVISGCVHLAQANPEERERFLNPARDAAEFLLWAQAEAGTGGFPFPAFRGTPRDNAFRSASRFLDQARQEGRWHQVVRNGWIIDDGQDGGLQFDNGEAGAALLELYQITQDTNYLAAARRAADWAGGRPLAMNWNYNSFSVHLLAKTFAMTGERRYLDAAIHKTRLGMIPGQLTDGPRAGRWLDPHNARPAYHYIMMRALVSLLAVLPPDHAARAEIRQALKLGLQARNSDFLGPGVPNKDYAMETLLLVQRTFASEPEFLRATHSSEALEALGKLVSEQARHGGAPLGPRPWGMLVDYVTRRPDRDTAEPAK